MSVEIKQLRLGAFIAENMEVLLVEWECYARRFWQGPIPSSSRLRNDAEHMLRAIVEDMAQSQTLEEQRTKSEGQHDDRGSSMGRTALSHALARVEDGFSIQRLVAEFRALRASVCRRWWETLPEVHKEQANDMDRFNEAIDELVAGSVVAFTERIDRSRQLFLGILGHDLRQPLATMTMLTATLGKPNFRIERLDEVVSSMEECCGGMSKMLSDLLDFTSSQLGSSLPVYPAHCSFGSICETVVAEIRIAVPGRAFNVVKEGDTTGRWDAARLRQLVANLVSNAHQHGGPDKAITVRLKGTEDEVVLEVHNYGRPIPEKSVGTLFDPMVRLAPDGKDRAHGSMGLGLFIVRQIAVAHGGEIQVASTAKEGTTFTVTLPRSGG